MKFKFCGQITNAADLQHVVEQFKRNAETPVRNAEPTFGDRLKAAVKLKLGGASYSRTQASAKDDDSFGNKLRKAVQKHPKSKEQTQKNADKDRARYLS